MRKTKRVLPCAIRILVARLCSEFESWGQNNRAALVERMMKLPTPLKKQNIAIQCDLHPLCTLRARGFAEVRLARCRSLVSIELGRDLLVLVALSALLGSALSSLTPPTYINKCRKRESPIRVH
jgi:hypothetical protein